MMRHLSFDRRGNVLKTSHEAVELIRDYNAGADPERLALKYKAMRQDAFIFFRGSCHLFNQRLKASGTLPAAPLAWNCGDLHLENFGSYKGDNKLVYFDVNDFDEAVLAPCSLDLVRVVASIAVAAKSLGLKRKRGEELRALFVDQYAAALRIGKARWIESETATGIFGDLLARLEGKTRRQQLAGRVAGSGGALKLNTDGTHALKAGKDDVQLVRDLLSAYRRDRPKREKFKIVDVARRIAGTGSLGVERYVILVRMNSDDTLALLDLKRSRPSSFTDGGSAKPARFPTEADRVVRVQDMMQAVSPARLVSIDASDRSYVLRVLQPSEDRFNLASLAGRASELDAVIAIMAKLVAWAQLRSSGRMGSENADALVEFAQGESWQRQSLTAADEMARLCIEDFKAYCGAVDDGSLAA